jgi:amino acid adenylation domain-containing protein
MVEDQKRSQPMRPAILAHDGQYTYAEMWAAVSKLARVLIREGARPEARAAILMEKCAYYPIAALAVLKSGAAFVPLDPGHPIQRLRQLVQDVDPFVVICTSSLVSLAKEITSNVLVIEQGLHRNRRYQFIKKPLAKPENAAYIIFTSGSTGKPKGVITEHAAFATSAMIRGKALGLGPQARVLQYAAHTFDVSVDEILTTLIHGGCVCVPSESERFDIGPAIQRMRVNYALLTPTFARMLDPDHVPSLSTIQLGGEFLSEDVNNKWSHRVRLFNVYGPTEASVASVMHERTGQKGAGHVIGFPVGTVCFIVDADDHNHLTTCDEVGELVIGGHTLARGYLNDTSRTDAAFLRAPVWTPWTKLDYPVRFYKTGDLASMGSNGLITIHGRKDNQIKLRGQRTNVEEIEMALSSNKRINAVIVALPKKGPFKNKLTAIMSEESSGDEPPIDQRDSPYAWTSKAKALKEDLESELHTSLKDIVPLAMIPSIWITLPKFPRNSSAKSDRKQIQSWLEEMDDATVRAIFQEDSTTGAKVEPSQKDCIASGLEEILCRVLNLPSDKLRLDQSFIRNGGDSITAMELRSLAKDMGISLEIRDILSFGRVKDLFSNTLRITEKSDMAIEEEPGKPCALSPTQKFYLEHTVEGTESFTQEVCLEVKHPATAETIQSGIKRLVSKHAMLRARFAKKGNEWIQWIAENNHQSHSMSTHVLKPCEDLKHVISNHQPLLHPVTGPVFGALLLLRDSKNSVLFLIAHHLVVDFVSWRILLQDLEGLISGDTLRPHTIPYLSWCRMQAAFTNTLDVSQILQRPGNSSNQAFWVPENGPLDNCHGSVCESNFSITASEAEALTDQCSKLYGTRLVEVILGALFRSFAMVFSDRETPDVFVESHGREPWDSAIDISRTVGWFTTAYPLTVPFEHAQDIGSAISYTKEQRRLFQDNGHAYWCCRYLTETGRSLFGHGQSMEFVFNFAGRYQQLDREASVFRRLSGVGEENAHPQAARLSIFDILVSTEAEGMEFKMTYPKNIRHLDRIHGLVETWKKTLLTIIHDELFASKSIAPSPEITNLLGQYLAPADAHAFRGVQEVYRPSKLQQHMLYSQARDPSYYKVVGNWRLKTCVAGSRIDLTRLQSAWRQVVKSHENLRTVFPYSTVLEEFVGVVLNDSDTDVVSDHDMALQNSVEITRPPYKMSITENDDGSVLMRLEFSHAIIDATSRDILLQAFLEAYQGRCITLSALRYQDYLNEVVRPDLHEGAPDHLRCIFPTDLHQQQSQAGILSTAVPPLSADLDPFEICRSAGITLSSIVFTTWSLILSKHTAMNDTCFVYTASDRLKNLSGIDAAVGCYVKLLVCSVQWTKETCIWEMAQRIQSDCTSCISGEVACVDAAEHLTNRRGEVLLNTMVNVRNTAGSKYSFQSELEVSLESFEDPWDVSTYAS